MNVRKPTDYSAMCAALDSLMTGNLPQMKLYCEIGRLAGARQEKGTAVAASEYLRQAYPDTAGFSPRNLRRMRDFSRMYEQYPAMMEQALDIGWTQNAVILDAELTVEECGWYIRAYGKFHWTKADLLEQIAASAHLHISLDCRQPSCYTKNINEEAEGVDVQIAVYLPRKYLLVS